jgi:putative transposase
VAHTFSNLLTHLVFSTKNWEPLIDDTLQDRLHAYLKGIIDRDLGYTWSIGGIANHVHVLADLKPSASCADAVRVLKTNSSRWVHKTFPNKHAFAWQVGYGAFSVSRSAAAQVEDYIRTQEEHHKRITFQEEFLLFLKRHGVDYDPEYLWRQIWCRPYGAGWADPLPTAYAVG